MQSLRPDPHHPIRKRLWQAGLAVGLFLTVIVIQQTVVRLRDGSEQLKLGGDYLPVYAAATLVREGRGAELYSIEPLAQIERQIVGKANLEPLPIYGPFLNPPFFAAAFEPLSRLEYRQSALAWLALNLLLLAGSIALLCRLPPPGGGWKDWGLVPLLIVLPIPFWQAMCHQQNTFLSLFLLCAIVTLWRRAAQPGVTDQPRQRKMSDVIAGVLAGLLFYKPQLALILSIALVLTVGRRALLGLLLAGGTILIATLWLMPGALEQYLARLPSGVNLIQLRPDYKWSRQMTPLGFWRLLIQGHGGGLTHLSAQFLTLGTMTIAAAALAAVFWRVIRQPQRPASFDRTIAATIVITPLLMPYFMDYDLLLLAVPAVLFAAEYAQSGQRLLRVDRLLLWAWIALFFSLYANPGVGGETRLNIAMPLIGTVAALSLARCLSKQVVSAMPASYHVRLGMAA